MLIYKFYFVISIRPNVIIIMAMIDGTHIIISHLDFNTLGTKSHGFIGNLDMMNKYGNAVLNQTKRSLEDKLDEYHVLI